MIYLKLHGNTKFSELYLNRHKKPYSLAHTETFRAIKMDTEQ
jgi:hypothetical protein